MGGARRIGGMGRTGKAESVGKIAISVADRIDEAGAVCIIAMGEKRNSGVAKVNGRGGLNGDVRNGI